MKIKVSPMISAPAPVVDHLANLSVAVTASIAILAASAVLLWSLSLHA